MPFPCLRIGTRGSPLARAQTEQVRRRLIDAEPGLAADGRLAVVVIQTTGDRIQDRPLADIGGKGLFTKEIDAAMLSRRIDLAAHSVKDLPTWLPDGLVLAAVLPRADPRDVVVGPWSLADLPPGAVVGTASLRRQAQLLASRPDLTVVPLRGNVGTRLEKMRAGVVTATLLARAGLERLGLTSVPHVTLDVDVMLPAVGQGAIGIVCREGDADVRALLAAVDAAGTRAEILAERAMLTALDGSCRTPIAGFARLADDGRLRLRGLVARPDGSRLIDGERETDAAGAAAAGHDLGEELKSRAGAGFFAVR